MTSEIPLPGGHSEKLSDSECPQFEQREIPFQYPYFSSPISCVFFCNATGASMGTTLSDIWQNKI